MALTYTNGNLVYVHDSETIDPTGETAAFAAEVAHVGNDKFLVGFIRQLNISAPGWAPQDLGMRLLQVNNDLTVTPGGLTPFDSEPLYVGRYRSPMVGVTTDKALLVGEQGIDAYTQPSFADDHLTAFLIDCSGALPTVSGSLEIDSTATSYMEFNTRGPSQIAILSPSRAIVTSRGTRNISHDTAWVQLLDISGASPVLLAGPTAVYVQAQYRNIQVIPISATTAILVWLDWADVGGTMRFAPRMQWMDVTGDTIQTTSLGYGPGPVVSTTNPIVNVDDEPGVQADGYNYLGAVKSGPGNKIILNAQYYNGTTTTTKFMQITYNPSDHSSFSIDSVGVQPSAPAGHTYTGDVRSSAGIVGVTGGALGSRVIYDDSVVSGTLEKNALYTVATQAPLTFGSTQAVSAAIDPLADPNDDYIMDHRLRMAANPSTGRGIMTATDYFYDISADEEFFSCFARSFRTTYTAPPGGGTGWGSNGVDGQWSVGQIAWH